MNMSGFLPRSITVIISMILAIALNSYAGKFQWKSPLDVPLLAGSLLGGYFSHVSFQQAEARYSDTTIPPEFNLLDDWAVGRYSRSMSLTSNILSATIVTPLLLSGLDSRNQKDLSIFMIDCLMFSEAMALSSSLNLWTRSALFKPRPFVFSSQAPLSKKINAEAYHSFYSGHASAAFLTAVYTSWTFQIRNPESRWTPWLWTASLSAATAISGLRILSGRHYPTDVLVGAAAGSLFGFLIPWSHLGSASSDLSLVAGADKVQLVFRLP